MEVVRKECEQELTVRLNSIDTTGSFKFTYEEENDNSLPFLGTLMTRKEDGTVKLLVYRKKAHTDQYLNFTSHHPLHQKLGSSKRYWIVATTSDQRIDIKSIINMWVPKWDHTEGERTPISEGKKNKEMKEKNTEKSKGYGHSPVCQRGNRTCTADVKTS